MSFDYSLIPKGYYDQVLSGPDGIRKFWHHHKFESVLRYIPSQNSGEGKSILDIGCFAGSFLGMVPSEKFSRQLGIDILPGQISYAQQKYGTNYREFRAYELDNVSSAVGEERFDVITLIEVIEHLNSEEITKLLKQIDLWLRPGGVVIITTPNYSSTWPILEFILNFISDVKYEEQHLTKFNFFSFARKLKNFVPGLHWNCRASTTTHFLSPFAAGISYRQALNMATAIPSANWNNPFGNIILSRWSRDS